MAENTSGMRPKMGDSSITLPVTFDYSGGRRDSKRSKTLWAVIVGIVGVIIGIGILFNKEGNIAVNLILGFFDFDE